MGKCPVCKGTLRKGEIEEIMFGVSLGSFQAEICDRCGESLVDEDTSKPSLDVGVEPRPEEWPIIRSS